MGLARTFISPFFYMVAALFVKKLLIGKFTPALETTRIGSCFATACPRLFSPVKGSKMSLTLLVVIMKWSRFYIDCLEQKLENAVRGSMYSHHHIENATFLLLITTCPTPLQIYFSLLAWSATCFFWRIRLT